MKKYGFTLAEVLITLGVIGVVAALSAPALIQNAGSAQVGPKLAKAVTTFELANENMLNDANAATIVATGAMGTGENETKNYIDVLSNHMKVNYINDDTYASLVKQYDGTDLATSYVDGLSIQNALQNIAISKDGILYGIHINQSFANLVIQLSKIAKPGSLLATSMSSILLPHKKALGTVVIDLNGKTKPNRLGKDIFVFELKADGTLTAVGAEGWSMSLNAVSKSGETKWHWYEGDDLCNENSVGTGLTCAGSVMANNLKVIY